MVFIWSVEMCFIFLDQINVIFMRPLYEAIIWCDYIINCYIKVSKVKPVYQQRTLFPKLGMVEMVGGSFWPWVVSAMGRFSQIFGGSFGLVLGRFAPKPFSP